VVTNVAFLEVLKEGLMTECYLRPFLLRLVEMALLSTEFHLRPFLL
jgi:hypothetical protein